MLKPICSQYNLFLMNSSTSKTSNYSCSWTNITLAFPTTILNLSLIIALASSRFRTKPCNILLMNLAITDLIVGSMNMPLFFVFFRNVAEGKDPCSYLLVLLLLISSVGYESFLIVTMIAVERYISIFHPFFHSSKLSSRNVTICIGISWTISFLIVIPLLVGVNSNMLFGCLGGTAIIVIMLNLYCYLRMLLQARRVRLQIQTEAARFGGRTINATDKRYIYLGILIVVSMVLCFSLEVVSSLLRIIGYNPDTLNTLVCWQGTLVAINSFINPFITCSFCPDIRRRILKILTCRVWCQRSN